MNVVFKIIWIIVILCVVSFTIKPVREKMMEKADKIENRSLKIIFLVCAVIFIVVGAIGMIISFLSL